MDPQAIEDERLANMIGVPNEVPASREEELEQISSSLEEAEYSEEKTAVILENIEISIGSGDVLGLSIYLDQLYIPKSLPEQSFQALFAAMMDFCVVSPNLEVVQAVVGKFEQANPDEDSLYFQVLIKIYLWDDVKIDHLRLIAKAFTSIQRPLFIIERFMKYREEVILLRALERIHEVFGPQPRSVYADIFNRATEAGNRVILDWVKSRISEDPDRVPKPAWVRNFTSEPVKAVYEIPEPPTFTFRLPPPEEAAQMILNGFGQRNLKIPENARLLQKLAQSYIEASEEQKLEMVGDAVRAEYMEKMASMEIYFRLIGPRHPMADFRSNNYNHPCLKYGGCAMHGCNHEPDLREGQVPDFNAPVPDYFTGICDTCNRWIPYRVWCVREPLINGSYSGCYCSSDCIEVAQDKRDPAITSVERDLLHKVMTDIERIGIQDRTSNLPILQWPEFNGQVHPSDEPIIDISVVQEIPIPESFVPPSLPASLFPVSSQSVVSV